MAEMKIGVVGCAGRMGRMLVRAVSETPGCVLAGGTEAPGSPAVGKDLGTMGGADAAALDAGGLIIGDDATALFDAVGAILDFTAPAVTVAHAGLAAERGVALIVGTTGLTSDQQAAIEEAAKRTVIVQAANYSIGVNLALGLTEQAARQLGPDDYDIEIVELHHHHKVDAPSGTALALGQAAAAGRGVDLDRVSDRGRDGLTGARLPGAIGFAVLRGGDVAGEHSVLFIGAGERIEIVHKATDRGIFARGAVHAALWSQGRAAGLYGMADVLGFG